ncbi:factor eIF-2B subunit delta [Seminavis robusta]|uniref:Translation initiation factor eIF2B subunit delta n=1 Tax=Seminavis robusta TaxID=568900 RepID=A0A9N8HBZ4_9STRA|nr:factor eIF-2B subunit delta [Seminavis robusta]|eukprot:Sro385_g131720.1 factor eIF-2B subunit delta (491) ;mRNA; r:50496-52122
MTTEGDQQKAAAAAESKKEKKKPEGLVIPPKKPKLSKAERRALQEQQRAAKAAAKQQPEPPKGAADPQNEPGKQNATKNDAGSAGKDDAARDAVQDKSDQKTVSLFSHLPPYRDPKSVVETGPHLWPKGVSLPSTTFPLHPAVIELGYQYAKGEIRGGNARCRAMLAAFHQVIGDFEPPTNNGGLTDMRHQIDQWILKPSFQYWTASCRPHSVTMGNAFTFLKTAVASLERDMTRDDMVEMIQETIDAYIRERIDLAKQAIAQQPALQLSTTSTTTTNNNNPQVFLTYGKSEAIAAIFRNMAASDQHSSSSFRVIIVDSRPLLEGKDLLLELRASGIECSYVLLNALTYVMRDVTKVYLGASALMSDGGVLGRVGTACVALSAHMHHIPVLVCCESYKISNRVQLESITGNELGDPSQVAMTTNASSSDDDDNNNNNGALKDWLETDNLRLLNLLYDLTPSEFVSGIVTELGIIPPTSVAVLLREMNPQN